MLKRLWLGLGALLLGAGVWAAPVDKVFKWVDEFGRVNYGNSPPQGVRAVPVDSAISVVPVYTPPEIKVNPPLAPKSEQSRPASGASVPVPPPERPRQQVEPCEPGVGCPGRPVPPNRLIESGQSLPGG